MTQHIDDQARALLLTLSRCRPGDRVDFAEARTPTRVGSYIRVRRGLTTQSFFAGENHHGRFLVERVG